MSTQHDTSTSSTPRANLTEQAELQSLAQLQAELFRTRVAINQIRAELGRTIDKTYPASVPGPLRERPQVTEGATSEDRPSQTTDEAMAALSAVRTMAHERAGHFSGFDCLLTYIPDEVLVEINPRYNASLFLTKEERTQRLSASFDIPETRFDAILQILNMADKSDDQSAATLSRRILTRMAASGRNGRTVRPLFYALAASSGIAVALAIHDEFWTDKW